MAAVPGITFFSLQKGDGQDEAKSPPPGMNLVDHSEDLKDFADTAALIAQLDLVISIDTAVCHLAGALGKPVWIMLPIVPDWRWLEGRDDSPWYPTAKLFRQSRLGEWKRPVEEMAAELRYTARR